MTYSGYLTRRRRESLLVFSFSLIYRVFECHSRVCTCRSANICHFQHVILLSLTALEVRLVDNHCTFGDATMMGSTITGFLTGTIDEMPRFVFFRPVPSRSVRDGVGLHCPLGNRTGWDSYGIVPLLFRRGGKMPTNKLMRFSDKTREREINHSLT